MSEFDLEQRANIKFLVQLGKSGSEIREMLVQVYGNNAMNKTVVYLRMTRFSEGRASVTNEERSGWLGGGVEKVSQIVRENHCLAVRSIAEQVNIEEQLRKS
jgi:hypothetical protein